jgi:hypothetical protein
VFLCSVMKYTGKELSKSSSNLMSVTSTDKIISFWLFIWLKLVKLKFMMSRTD